MFILICPSHLLSITNWIIIETVSKLPTRPLLKRSLTQLVLGILYFIITLTNYRLRINWFSFEKFSVENYSFFEISDYNIWNPIYIKLCLCLFIILDDASPIGKRVSAIGGGSDRSGYEFAILSSGCATGVAAATASVGGVDGCEASPIEIKDSSEEEGLELDDKEEPEECC